MVMTTNNLCDSCTNIGCEFQSGIVRTKCAFYMQPTVDAIQKDQYEARLKDDVVAMLTEIQLEIEELDLKDSIPDYTSGAEDTRDYITNMIEETIDKLKGE